MYVTTFNNRPVKIWAENVEESAMRQIGQNGNARIVFTHFALAVSKQINRLR